MEIAGYLLAAVVGISLGLIGGGGSILTVPILVYILGVNPVLATSYSLFIVGSTSLVGAYNNYRSGWVDIKIALLFGISSITTVFITRKILMPLIPRILFSTAHFHVTQELATMILFAVLMLLASIIITLIAIAGVFVGGFLSKKINGEKLKKAFGWFVLVMGIYILVKELFFP